jgi:hypothetical protein
MASDRVLPRPSGVNPASGDAGLLSADDPRGRRHIPHSSRLANRGDLQEQLILRGHAPPLSNETSVKSDLCWPQTDLSRAG